MANNEVLAVLEFLAIASCVYGMYQIHSYSNSYIVLTYNALWFVLGILSNLSGLCSIGLSYIEPEDAQDKSNFFLQYHYLLAWFTVILGYPTLVSSFWMIYYPTVFAHAHAALALIPVIAWILKQNRVIVLSTQIVSAVAIASHAYICYLAQNNWGLVGAGIMIWNVVSISMPTRYNLMGLTSRESFIVGLTSASYVLTVAVSEMANKPTPVKTIVPW